MNCKKCGGKTTSKGMMKSGNSKYEIFKCESCGEEMMRCIGLLQPM